MMNGHYIQRMQQYDDMRREAHEWRLARAAGMAKYPSLGLLRSIAGRLWGWLSRRISQPVASEQAPLHLAAKVENIYCDLTTRRTKL